MAGVGFSTLGLPGAPIDEALRLARSTGFRVLEIRAAAGDPVAGPDAAVDALRVRLADAGVRVVALTTPVRVCAGSAVERAAELVAHLRLAARLGAPAVRVFPGASGDATATAVEVLAAALPIAADVGVRVLLETHDSHPTVAAAAGLLDAAGAEPALAGVLWDSAHTWAAGEEPEASIERLGPRRSHVQVKDVDAADAPVPLGRGVVPIDRIARALEDDSWPWTAVLEWERAWHPALPPLAEALDALPRWAPRLVPGGDA